MTSRVAAIGSSPCAAVVLAEDVNHDVLAERTRDVALQECLQLLPELDGNPHLETGCTNSDTAGSAIASSTPSGA